MAIGALFVLEGRCVPSCAQRNIPERLRDLLRRCRYCLEDVRVIFCVTVARDNRGMKLTPVPL